MRTYLTIPCHADDGSYRTLMIDCVTSDVLGNVAYSPSAGASFVEPIIATAQAAYGSNWQIVSQIAKLIGVSDANELVYAIGIVQSGGALNFMRDTALVAFSTDGDARIIASNHAQADAPAWMGDAPDLYFAAGGGEECYFFCLDPDQPDPPSGVITYAVYGLSNSGYSKTTLTLPSGFLPNSAGQFVKADNGESMWVISDDQTSSSNLYLVRKVGATWTNKRNLQVTGDSIPLAAVQSLAAADGVGSLDFIRGDSRTTMDIAVQGLDDLGNYSLAGEVLSSSAMTGSLNVRDIMSGSLGPDTDFAGAPSFTPRAELPPLPFWANMVGVEVA